MRQRIKVDVLRVLSLAAFATVVLLYSTPFAVWVGEPEFAPLGLVTGNALYMAALSHALRRLLFPYVDLKEYAARAKDSPLGAAVVFVGVCIVLYGLFGLFSAGARAQDLPPNARLYLPTLQKEHTAVWLGERDLPAVSLFAAQVEQETCITLRHRSCWSPRAELKTHRERGVGLGQITRTTSFDSLAELRRQYATELAGFRWEDDSIYDPSLQLRAMLLMDRRNWKVVLGTARPRDREAMMLASYNGGLGGLSSDRKLCSATPGCNPGLWFGHVELTSLKAKRAVSGYGKSFYEINREYPRNIMHIRQAKYRVALEE